MIKKPLVLVGGGGHCISCIDVIEQEGKFDIVGIVDVKEKIGENILNYPIMGCDDNLPEIIGKYNNALITVGQIKSASLRYKLYNLLKELNANLPVIVSSSAQVSKYANIEEGTIVMHQALVNAEATIGVNNIINSKALIEHEVCIGNHCHISTGCMINGQVQVGDKCFVGSGSTIANNVSIQEQVIIPAGTTVLNNIERPGIYIKNRLDQRVK